MVVDSANVPIGARESYPAKTPPFSRDLIDWAKENLIGPPGLKGDKPEHEWSGTELRFQNPDGTWGVYTDLIGLTGANAPYVTIEYSEDGTSWHGVYNSLADIYIHFSYDGGTTYDSTLRIVGEKGDQGIPADNIKVQYSIDNVVWSDIPTTPTNYIRFSLNNGDTWEASYVARGTDGINGLNGTNAPEVVYEYQDTDTGWTGTGNSYTGTEQWIRISTDGEVTWSSSIKFVGDDGLDGANAYLYVAWADDSDGNGFTLIFSDTKDFRAEIQSDTVISSPNQGNFTGLWKDISGQEGEVGAIMYTYVGYASDDLGSNYSSDPSETLHYIAFLITGTLLSPPAAGDFTGLWKKYKGDAGTNASYIELPSSNTVHGRIVAGIIEQPLGWTMDSGDQISNPLSTNPIDLVINHGEGKEVIAVSLKSKTTEYQIKLNGAAAMSTFLDDDTKNYLCIKSFSETETIIGIYILFES